MYDITQHVPRGELPFNDIHARNAMPVVRSQPQFAVVGNFDAETSFRVTPNHFSHLVFRTGVERWDCAYVLHLYVAIASDGEVVHFRSPSQNKTQTPTQLLDGGCSHHMCVESSRLDIGVDIFSHKWKGTVASDSRVAVRLYNSGGGGGFLNVR